MTGQNERQPLTTREKIALTVAGVVALIISLGVAGYMLTHKPQPQRRKPIVKDPTVDVKELVPTSYQVSITVQGIVNPATEVDLKTRVGGEVIWVHPELIEGGIVKKGQTLVRIDPVDYELALTSKKAGLESAIYDLKAEQGQQEIARTEWDLLGLGKDASELDRELALRQPQLAVKQAQLKAAQAEVKQAELALQRTEIKAPFDAIVQSASIDAGGQVTTQGILARLVGSTTYYVEALIPQDRLKWVVLPDGDSASSTALVNTGTGRMREGRVFKLMGDLEPTGKLARLLIEVKDPMDLKFKNGDRHPMLLGDYVTVQIQGRTVDEVFLIERDYLNDGNYIYIVDEENRLRILELEIIWRGEAEVVAMGLLPGTRMVVSDLPAPVEGMRVNVTPPQGMKATNTESKTDLATE